MIIRVCYEKDRSGETIVAESIYKELSKIPGILVEKTSSDTFTKGGFLYTVNWLKESFLYWFKVLSTHRRADWIITTTYTAGIIALMLKPFYGHRICFCYQGSRVPPKHISASFVSRLLHRAVYILIVFLHKVFISGSDRILVPSDYSLKQLVDLHAYGDVLNKIVKLPNGVDLTLFHPLQKDQIKNIKSGLHIGAGDKLILYAGRITRQKGVFDLLKAIAIYQRVHSHISLVIATSASVIEDEKKLLSELKNLVGIYQARNIFFMNKNRHHLAKIMAASDVVVLPSYEDHFPLVMLEAFASGALFLGTPVGSMPVFLNNIDSRLILNNHRAESIVKSLDFVFSLTKSQRDRLLEKSYEKIINYSWASAATQLLLLLNNFDNNRKYTNLGKV